MTLTKKIRLAWKYRRAIRLYLRMREHRVAIALAAGALTGAMLVRGFTRPVSNA